MNCLKFVSGPYLDMLLWGALLTVVSVSVIFQEGLSFANVTMTLVAGSLFIGGILAVDWFLRDMREKNGVRT